MKKTIDSIHVRDPIYGSIQVSSKEIALIDHPIFQRLRHIKQLGFTDLAFPGATHSRYAHSLGAMHLATRFFDQLHDELNLPIRIAQGFRQAVRIAMLFHDIGHPPFSHTTEAFMPSVKTLKLPALYACAHDRKATHEDYTLQLVLDSPLAKLIEVLFGDMGISGSHIASLLTGISSPLHEPSFMHQGVHYLPLLKQIVTSEIDADRMDYLQRDSFYCGVNYGKCDTEWLIRSITPIIHDKKAFLGIRSRAMFSFEDFLLSRYHMFASVYLHHTPVIFEQFLKRCLSETKEFSLPSDIEKYAQIDDVTLLHFLRSNPNKWAQRIVQRRSFYLLDEIQCEPQEDVKEKKDRDEVVERLQAKGIDTIKTSSKSILSQYFGEETPHIFVLTHAGHCVPLASYTPVYKRYKDPAEIVRIYVDSEHKEAAKRILKSCQGEKIKKR